GSSVSVDLAQAATITVNTSNDDTAQGDHVCSRRKAIEAVDSPGAASGDCAPAAFGANTILLPAGDYTLNSGALTVGATVTELTITGAGEVATKIDGLNDGSVLSVAAGAGVSLTNLTVTDGQATAGSSGLLATPSAGGAGQDGGAIVNQGTLGLIDVAVTDSHAGNGGVTSGLPGGDGGDGGGIYNAGTLGLAGVTLAGDSAGAGGNVLSNTA